VKQIFFNGSSVYKLRETTKVIHRFESQVFLQIILQINDDA